LLCFLLLQSVTAYSAEDVSSLENKILQSKGDDKVAFIIEFVKEGSCFSPEKSIQYINEALKLVTENSAEKTLLSNYLGLSKLYLNEFSDAEDILQQALSIAKTAKHKALIYHSLSLLANELNDHKKAIHFIELGFVLAKELNDPQLIGDYYYLKATIYLNSFEHVRAIEVGLFAYQYYKQANNNEAMAMALTEIGSSYRRMAAFDKALEYNLKSLSLQLKTGSKKRVAISYNNVAIIYKDLKDYENAIAMHLKSLAIKESIGYLKGQVYSHNNLGETYRLSDNTDKSLFHLTEALKLARKIKSKKLQHYSYLYLGRLHRDIGQYQEAGKYLTEAIAYFTQKKHNKSPS